MPPARSAVCARASCIWAAVEAARSASALKCRPTQTVGVTVDTLLSPAPVLRLPTTQPGRRNAGHPGRCQPGSQEIRIQERASARHSNIFVRQRVASVRASRARLRNGKATSPSISGTLRCRITYVDIESTAWKRTVALEFTSTPTSPSISSLSRCNAQNSSPSHWRFYDSPTYAAEFIEDCRLGRSLPDSCPGQTATVMFEVRAILLQRIAAAIRSALSR